MPKEDSTNTYETINYNMFQYGFTNPHPFESPLTTKGDLIAFDTDNVRLPVGADGLVLTANSSTATGLEWAAAGGGGGPSPLTTKGDIFTYDTGDARLPVGTDGQLLVANSATSTGLEWIDDDDRITLTANTTFYVNQSTGSDVTGDGTIGNPWQTAQFALDYVEALDCNNFQPTIDFSGEDYTSEGILHLPPILNPQTITCGGGASPANAQLIIRGDGVGSTLFLGWEADQPGYYALFNLRVVNGANNVALVKANRGAIIDCSDVNLAGNNTTTTGIGLFAYNGGIINLQGTINFQDDLRDLFFAFNGGGIYSGQDESVNAVINVESSFNGTTTVRAFRAVNGTIDVNPSFNVNTTADIFNFDSDTFTNGTLVVPDALFDDLVSAVNTGVIIEQTGTINGTRIGRNVVNVREETLTTPSSSFTVTLDDFEKSVLDVQAADITISLPGTPYRGLSFTFHSLPASSESIFVTESGYFITPGTTYITTYSGSAWEFQVIPAIGEVNIETLTSDKVLTVDDEKIQVISTSGANRNITLPTADVPIGYKVTIFHNDTNSGFNLTVLPSLQGLNTVSNVLAEGESIEAIAITSVGGYIFNRSSAGRLE